MSNHSFSRDIMQSLYDKMIVSPLNWFSMKYEEYLIEGKTEHCIQIQIGENNRMTWIDILFDIEKSVITTELKNVHDPLREEFLLSDPDYEDKVIKHLLEITYKVMC